MALIEELGERLARDVLAAREELGDPYFYEKVSKVLGAASPTMQEAFMTAIKMYLAEERGRQFLYQTVAAIRGVSVSDVAATMSAAPVAAAPAPAPVTEAAPAKAAPTAEKAKPAVSAAVKARMISEALAAFGDDPVPPKPTPHSGT